MFLETAKLGFKISLFSELNFEYIQHVISVFVLKSQVKINLGFFISNKRLDDHKLEVLIKYLKITLYNVSLTLT